MNDKLHSPLTMTRWKGKQRRIGITGGIATGKSTVSKFLYEIKNIPIIDADQLSQAILAPNTESTKLVLQHFGNKIRNKNYDSINRNALGQIIFSNPNEKYWLESIIHPIIINNIYEGLEKLKNKPSVILTMPLLFETNLTDLCSEIWLINCTKTQQIKRLMQRDRLNEEEALLRINSQWSLERKKDLADVIIDNTSTKEKCIQEIEYHLSRI
tara:strand:- start:1230 stop:1868 length:639 start_codon:yes stop_codon:yes gene_type:complete